MPIINFKEIPVPTQGADRDMFELFAREFLEFLGFKIVVGPDRGPDAGRDLIVKESRTGIAGETQVKWLVSCKHQAHSGRSVTPQDEPDIHDRVRTHGCNGFLCFYSTNPSSGLAAKLNAPNLSFEVLIYDAERIEKHLLANSFGTQLAKRFFPRSIANWEIQHPTPARIFEDTHELLCFHCGKSLLTPTPRGIVVVWKTLRKIRTSRQAKSASYVHLYWCCKGACDRALNERYRRKGIVDAWEDIPDIIIPTIYIHWIMVMLRRLHNGGTYSEEALNNCRGLLLNLFPLVSRHLTEGEESRVEALAAIPSFFGGLGQQTIAGHGDG
jgi:hypothetical protein